MRFYFDKEARIEFDCEAADEDAAIALFTTALARAGRENGGVEITIDGLTPERVEEDEPEINHDNEGL
jgi:hypothetical protein